MRILYASERPPYPFFLGGAARSAHQLMQVLSREEEVACAALGSSEYQVTPWSFPPAEEHASLDIHAATPEPGNPRAGSLDCGYAVHVLPNFYDSLAAFMDEFKPDIVWSQLEGARQVLELAQRKGVRGLYFVHDAEFQPAELRAIAALGGHIVCSSRFLAGKIQQVTGRPAQVIYPPTVLYFDIVGAADGYVTMINPHPVKGLDTFMEIARRMPEVQFLLLESWKLGDEALAALGQRLADLPNVRFQCRTTDMRAIYRQTRLLLVPSRWEEGFGMVAVEAQSCGIPVIASARGGLPESVGDGGILLEDYQNAEAWVAAIGPVLQDPRTYRELAERARQHAASADFSAPSQARRLAEICASEPAGTSPIARHLHAARLQLQRLPVLGRLVQRPGP